MHMWGRRLCLCQFLDFIDSHKYKCTPTSVDASATNILSSKHPLGLQHKTKKSQMGAQIEPQKEEITKENN